MRTKKTFVTFLMAAALITVIGGCESDETIQSKLNKLDGLGYFPMQVGNYWKFPNTSKITIDARETINNLEYYRFVKDNDTTYYRETADGKIYSLKKGGTEVLQFVLNANAGQLWTTTKSSNDSLYVALYSKTEIISLNNLPIRDCYKFFYDEYSQRKIDNEYTTWLAPNIGWIQTDAQIGLFQLEEVQIDGVKIIF